MFRASAQSYRDEIDSGLYNENQILQMSAQAITWTEAADSLENMYLLDSTPTHIENFEQDLDDVILDWLRRQRWCVWSIDGDRRRDRRGRREDLLSTHTHDHHTAGSVCHSRHGGVLCCRI